MVQPVDSKFNGYFPDGAQIEKIHEGSKWAEGPVFFADGNYLLWSDVPNDRIFQWIEGLGVRIFREPSGKANGNTRDLSGRLVTCETDNRRITKTEPDGSIVVLVDRYEGKRFNSPNDITVKSDGTIWFTDPDYGLLHARNPGVEKEIDGKYVFRFDPETGAISIAADDFEKPNGIAFSPDESLLYIADSGMSHRPGGPQHIRSFQVNADGSLSGSEVVVEVRPGLADGFRIDVDGNIWTSAGDGVHCYNPAGDLLGKVPVPETVSNLTFGGTDGCRLFITATTSVYSIQTNQPGS